MTDALTNELRVYVIKTGDYIREVAAVDENAAVIATFKADPPSSCGTLTEILLKDGDPDVDCWYGLTANFLQQAGYKVNERSAK